MRKYKQRAARFIKITKAIVVHTIVKLTFFWRLMLLGQSLDKCFKNDISTSHEFALELVKKTKHSVK